MEPRHKSRKQTLELTLREALTNAAARAVQECELGVITRRAAVAVHRCHRGPGRRRAEPALRAKFFCVGPPKVRAAVDGPGREKDACADGEDMPGERGRSDVFTRSDGDGGVEAEDFETGCVEEREGVDCGCGDCGKRGRGCIGRSQGGADLVAQACLNIGMFGEEKGAPGESRRGGFVSRGHHGEHLVGELVVGEIVAPHQEGENVVALVYCCRIGNSRGLRLLRGDEFGAPLADHVDSKGVECLLIRLDLLVDFPGQEGDQSRRENHCRGQRRHLFWSTALTIQTEPYCLFSTRFQHLCVSFNKFLVWGLDGAKVTAKAGDAV